MFEENDNPSALDFEPTLTLSPAPEDQGDSKPSISPPFLPSYLEAIFWFVIYLCLMGGIFYGLTSLSASKILTPEEIIEEFRNSEDYTIRFSSYILSAFLLMSLLWIRIASKTNFREWFRHVYFLNTHKLRNVSCPPSMMRKILT